MHVTVKSVVNQHIFHSEKFFRLIKFISNVRRKRMLGLWHSHWKKKKIFPTKPNPHRHILKIPLPFLTFQSSLKTHKNFHLINLYIIKKHTSQRDNDVCFLCFRLQLYLLSVTFRIKRPVQRLHMKNGCHCY